ncbi:type II CAAX endopeptidase family protein [Lactobacillus kefiranofaciens]|uniref:Type II CAAX endopeptidase family protein n=1 Tax=Lactobacillus kefiranofaciens TaxID=267818 RepID=A0AAX3UCR0_9LACO|nr:type II CAAX endopeptidase family protein [Lactobacillus kefiranofaciens]AEG41266.1 Metal-dependent membrane protease [Lactobacillus kefiranofaciens subsp. kefiranofaciens]KRL28839.1 metal-dependent membrane protease [Lactobacillus kefiranofaciens subsp. kefirgranum DSM 10550 = JCM 8572]KRM19953.1 metal-dependent membrane protease [Lactobacillus kefiranofaciens subsp. kefiranofaciens DSM 5016 = JCM 6985]MCJ2173071.1 CPBP family intramembrane metalloprotease [Lactobacillus kefiranofaciens]MC
MSKFWHYLGNIAGIILAFALYMVLQILYFYPRKVELGHSRVIVTALVTVIVLFLIFYLYKKQLKEANDWGFNREPHWDMRRIGIAILGFILMVLGAAVMLHIAGGISENQQGLDRIEQSTGDLFKIMVVFIAPFCEEVIFRGMFFNIFFTKETKTNKWLGILASGFVFGYMHDPMLSKYIFIYWVLGIVLAWIYTTTKDLRYSMLVHMCYNALGFI